MNREQQDLFDACRDLVAAAGLLGPRPLYNLVGFPAGDCDCWIDLHDGLLLVDIDSHAGEPDEAGECADFSPQCCLRVELDLRAGTAAIDWASTDFSGDCATDVIALLDELTDAVKASRARKADRAPLFGPKLQLLQGGQA